MPRVKPQLIRYAANQSRDLATLLPVCRDLSTARQELRWIREHVNKRNFGQMMTDERVSRLCYRRGRLGHPLQYVLGSQPFGGNLDLLCRPGVLIPRNDTEEWVGRLLRDVLWKERQAGHEGRKKKTRIVDFCTGTGCVALFLAQGLAGRMKKGGKGKQNLSLDVQIYGFDVSDQAVALARENFRRNREAFIGLEEDGEEALEPGREGVGSFVRFEKGDVFSDDWVGFLRRQESQSPEIDVLVANPPYISEEGFRSASTARSVRKFEPKLALVPGMISAADSLECSPEDVFYARLLDLARDPLRPKIVVFEVGDMEQAVRVATMAAGRAKSGDDSGSIWTTIEIWRDDAESAPGEGENEAKMLETPGRIIPIRGSGQGRAVFLRRGAEPALS